MRRGIALLMLAGLGACSTTHQAKADPCAPVVAQQRAYERAIDQDRATAGAGPTSCDLKCELNDTYGVSRASVDEQRQFYLWATMIVQNASCFKPGDRASAQTYIDAHRP